MGTPASADRRDPNAPRRPIRATVDLTPSDDRETWQADAVDLSMGGMTMRANLLPEVGEHLSLMFRPEGASTVSARAEVVWAQDKGAHAGVFGVRFVDIPVAAEQSLRRMLENGVPKDDVMLNAGVKLPADDSRVKLYIHGMDAPLRARVRSTGAGEMMVGSDLSFLKLGDKVDVDGSGTKVTGVIDGVEVEIDPKTRVPRLVLSIDLGGKKKKAELGNAATVLAESPRPSEHELPTVKAVAQREPMKPVKTALVEEAVVIVPREKKAIAPEARHVAQATAALVSNSDGPEISAQEADLSFSDEPPPGWLTQGMRTVRGAVDRVGQNAGPVMRRALDAVGGLRERIAARRDGEEGDETKASRRGLRPQHPESSDAGGDALVTGSTGRNRKVGLYAVVGLVLAAGIVAYASSSGPRVETPHPQVAVGAETPAADPNAPAAQTPESASAADPSTQNEPVAAAPGEGTPAQPEPRWVAGRAPRGADLAAAANAVNGQSDGEAPIIQNAPQRPVRALPQGINRAVPVRPAIAQRGVAQPAPAQRAPVMQQPVNVAQGVARPAVFGNPSVRAGTVLHLRMDGPIAAIQGVGARGAQIVLTVPGRRSLDVAAPFASQDPRIAGAGVMNAATGASLTLRFREAAPPFVARSRGNMLEIVLAPTPGGAPMRAAVRPQLSIRERLPR